MKVVLVFFWICCCTAVSAQKKKHFTLHDLPFNENELLRTNGIYIQTANTVWGHSTFYAFYKNGIFYHGPAFHNTTLASDLDDTVRFVDEILCISSNRENSHRWGFYRVFGDTLIMQRPQSGVTKFNGWQVREEKWLLSGAKAVPISYRELPPPFSQKSRNRPIKDNGSLYFYSTDKKPDSTNAWFYNEEWYKRQ